MQRSDRVARPRRAGCGSACDLVAVGRGGARWHFLQWSRPRRLCRRRNPSPDLVIHEWGTFLAMSGSDGATLDGMYHEEHALPAIRPRPQPRPAPAALRFFSRARRRSSTSTPSGPSRSGSAWGSRGASGRSGIPRPGSSAAARPAGPATAAAEGRPDLLVRGHHPAGAVDQRIEAGTGEIPAIPATSADALWNYAREVDAAYVRTIDGTKEPAVPEYERFLFYRGLGRVALALAPDRRQGRDVEPREGPDPGRRHPPRLRRPGRERTRGVPVSARAASGLDRLRA